MKRILKELMEGKHCSREVARDAMASIINLSAQRELIGAFLTAYQFEIPTSMELAGFVEAFRSHTVEVPLHESIRNKAMDVCGTGGDGRGTFNISTAVAFTLASAGVPVAKHGNRAISSQCGSFDVLEALGIPFSDSVLQATQNLHQFNLAFLYAPFFQPVFRELAPIRRNLGFRTILNLLGPLLNPARVGRQLIGVYVKELVVPVAEALGELGTVEAMVVHGDDVSDELSLCSSTTVAHLRKGKILVSEVSPEDFGLMRTQAHFLSGGSPSHNAQIILNVLGGQAGPCSDVIVLNAAAGLVVAGKAENFLEGAVMARSILESGSPLLLLEKMRMSAELGAVL